MKKTCVSPVTTIRILEDQWMQSRLNGDVTFSRSCLSDNYIGLTPDGTRQNKTLFLANIIRWDKQYEACTASNRVIKVVGNGATSTGSILLASTTSQYSFNYQRAYLRNCGNWQLVSSKAVAS